MQLFNKHLFDKYLLISVTSMGFSLESFCCCCCCCWTIISTLFSISSTLSSISEIFFLFSIWFATTQWNNYNI